MIILALLLSFKLLFLAFPEAVLGSARSGLILWFNNVLPALLPFMVVTNMLVMLGFARQIGNTFSPAMRRVFGLPGAGGFAFVVGLTSGYPIGAKTIADLHKNGDLDTRESQHLVAFCNNAGPLFILGVVGVGMFGSAAAGYILWAGHVIGAVLIGVLLRKQSGSVANHEFVRTVCNKGQVQHSLSKVMGDAIKNAMESMLAIGGLIIFFSAIMAVLEKIGLPQTGLLSGLFGGLLEVTGGVRDISQTGISVASMGLAAFLVAFGGLSVHMQTLHFVEGTGIRTMPYIQSKVLHGVVAAVVTIFLWVVIQ